MTRARDLADSADKDIAGTVTLDDITLSNDITLADNGKAIFGAGSDLQIYHDGNSKIADVGDGKLELHSNGTGVTIQKGATEYMAQFLTDGAVQLYYDGGTYTTPKLATTSTGIDVTGTVTADGLTVDGSSTLDDIRLTAVSLPAAGNPSIALRNTDNNVYIQSGSGNAITLLDSSQNTMLNATPTSHSLAISNGNAFSINSGRDISFYEDTGTTAKLTWSASTESLRFDSATLQAINGTDPFLSGNAYYDGSNWKYATSTDATNYYQLGREHIWRSAASGTAGNNITWSESMRIDSSGNVGIGTNSPDSVGTGHPTLDLKGNSASQVDRSGAIYFTRYDGTKGMYIAHSDGANVFAGLSTYPMIFRTDNTEAMRIDSSGNLLVGGITTLPSSSVNGFGVLPTGIVVAAVSNDKVTVFNRNGLNGDISLFQKDGSTVGSIGVLSSDNVYFGGSVSGHAGLIMDGSSIVPLSALTRTNDAIDLGDGSYRFDDIYATNGTINTSDRNEKQDIEELTDAEQRVAVACKGLLRKFRWKSAVAEKGDEARTHFGIIAQDLQAAFAAEGLDAGDYAMFISSTWTDEETGEERTRMGVRYSELLAFIIGAL